MGQLGLCFLVPPHKGHGCVRGRHNLLALPQTKPTTGPLHWPFLLPGIALPPGVGMLVFLTLIQVTGQMSPLHKHLPSQTQHTLYPLCF